MFSKVIENIPLAFTSLNTMASSFSVNENQFEVQHTVQSVFSTSQHPKAARLWNAALPLAASHLSCKLLADASGTLQGKVHTCSGNWWLSLAAGAAWTEENSSCACPREAAKGCTLCCNKQGSSCLKILSKETNTELFNAHHGYALSKRGRVTSLPPTLQGSHGGKLFPRKGDGELLGKVPAWQR